ncbi:hypothetical protein JL101_036380 (plasmid) [Skermanella rosea]|uniref:hypothetical protein n=1 Tax=Skermanella rosea TaxID=1817965 RepID=UPI0019314361|nr:hypothetical protein [Skermanella rosea]UEM08221.1 hypothetical protein JL101_036380 [Skermanella rosea]
MDVVKYAEQVADTYAKHGDNRHQERARVIHVNAANLAADTNHEIGYTKGSRIANQTTLTYDAHREKGMGHDQARAQTAQDMAQRFSRQGNDLTQTQRQYQTQGMSRPVC